MSLWRAGDGADFAGWNELLVGLGVLESANSVSSLVENVGEPSRLK